MFMKKLLLFSVVSCFVLSSMFFNVFAQTTISSCSNTNPWGTVQCVPGEYWFNGACRTADNCSGLKEANFSACGCVCTAASRAATSPSCDVDTANPSYVGTQTRVFSNSSCTYSCKTKSQTFLTKFDGSTGNNVEASVVFQDGSDLVIGGMQAANNDADPNGKDLKLDVDGAIGAAFYCDSDGDNCIAGSALGALGKSCNDTQILKWTGGASGGFACVADDAGTGTLPSECAEDEIVKMSFEYDRDGNGTACTAGATSATASDPGVIWDAGDDKDANGTCDDYKVWACSPLPEGADGLAGTNGIGGADGLVGQTGSTDADYCADGEVLTWKVGPYDYDNDSDVCTEGATALTASDPSVVWDAGDDLNLDGVCGTGATETDSAWICAPGGGSDGSNYWTKTGTDLSYSDGKVGIGVVAPNVALDVLDDIQLSDSDGDYLFKVSKTDFTLPAGLPISGSAHFRGKSFLMDSGVVIDRDANITLPANYELNVGGSIGGKKYCNIGVKDDGTTPIDEQTILADECIDSGVLTSMRGVDKDNVPCAKNSVLTWDDILVNSDGTTGGWNCVAGGASSFLGLTGASNGVLSTPVGYLGAKEICEAAFPLNPNAHMCTVHELTQALMNGETVLDPTKPQVWINNGAPGYISTLSNDCQGWTDETNGSYGSVLARHPSTGAIRFLINTCDMSFPVACCN
jgi:hypothetical protein